MPIDSFSACVVRARAVLRSSMPKTGKSTLERISGQVVQEIIAIAAIHGTSNINHIRTLAGGVHHTTVERVLEREAETIAKRKNELAPIFARIVRRGAERLEREIDNPDISPVAVATITGISADKLIALTPTDTPTSPNLHLHLSGQDVAGQWNALLASIQSKPAKAITVPDPRASSVSAPAARTQQTEPFPSHRLSLSPVSSFGAQSDPAVDVPRASASVVPERVRAITSKSSGLLASPDLSLGASAIASQDPQKDSGIDVASVPDRSSGDSGLIAPG